jgi:acetoin utilization protein AcuC
MPVVLYHPGYEAYAFGEHHPFSPERIKLVLDLLESLGHSVELVVAPPASREDLLTVHEAAFVDRVAALGAGADPELGLSYGLGTPDTPVFPGMDEAARNLVGGTLHGARLIASGAASRVLQLGGGLHHASSRLASGFCVYNDLAVAIRHFVSCGLRVAYLDLDVHHGDGVQQIFERDSQVLTVSLHESGQYLFPGTGQVNDLGTGPGFGLKLNLPLEPMTEGDSYLDVFERVIPLALDHFRPQVLVVQAGADAHCDDDLADLLLTTHTYEALYRRVLALADLHTEGRVLFTLGGGYSMAAAPRVWTLLTLLLHDLPLPEELPSAWRERWRTLLGGRPPQFLHDTRPTRPMVEQHDAICRRNLQVAHRLLEALRPIWFGDLGGGGLWG